MCWSNTELYILMDMRQNKAYLYSGSKTILLRSESVGLAHPETDIVANVVFPSPITQDQSDCLESLKAAVSKSFF